MDLKRLKIKRGVVRTSTTKLARKIDDALGEEEPCLKKLEELLEQLMERELILKEYDRDVEVETEEEDGQSRQSENRSGSGPPRMNTVKLPKLVIQKFSGEICEWQGFWSQYETTIYDNERLSKTDKFSYLKSFLTGTAASAVAGLALSGINYDIAIDVLKKRFGRKDLEIGRAHV